MDYTDVSLINLTADSTTLRLRLNYHDDALKNVTDTDLRYKHELLAKTIQQTLAYRGEMPFLRGAGILG